MSHVKFGFEKGTFKMAGRLMYYTHTNKTDDILLIFKTIQFLISSTEEKDNLAGLFMSVLINFIPFYMGFSKKVSIKNLIIPRYLVPELRLKHRIFLNFYLYLLI